MNDDDQAQKIKELEARISELEQKLEALIVSLKEKDMLARMGGNPLDVVIK